MVLPRDRPLTLRPWPHPSQKAWRLIHIVLVLAVVGLVGAFAGVAVPWLGSAADGARNCVFVVFANIQLVGFVVRVRAPSAEPRSCILADGRRAPAVLDKLWRRSRRCDVRPHTGRGTSRDVDGSLEYRLKRCLTAIS
jgi:hypothetical protein